jgi:hypothetical protein
MWGVGQKWSVYGQYAHFMLSWSTQQTMPVGCGQMRWQSDKDRRGKEVEHLHSVSIYTNPIGNLIHTILWFAHTVNRYVLANQTTKIQPAQATLNPWTHPLPSNFHHKCFIKSYECLLMLLLTLLLQSKQFTHNISMLYLPWQLRLLSLTHSFLKSRTGP